MNRIIDLRLLFHFSPKANYYKICTASFSHLTFLWKSAVEVTSIKESNPRNKAQVSTFKGGKNLGNNRGSKFIQRELIGSLESLQERK